MYILLKPANQSLSLLAGWFWVVYAAIFTSTLFHLSNVLRLLNGSAYLKVLETNRLHAQVIVSLNTFTDGWNLGLIIFGLHLLVLSYLAFRSGYVPSGRLSW